MAGKTQTELLQVTGGTPGNGKVLTSDAGGNATWQDPPSSPPNNDNVIGNEVVGTANNSLTRSGSGTAGSPYELQINQTTTDGWYVNENQANSISSPMIIDGAVANRDIENDAVNSAKIQNGTVTGDDIADGTIRNADVNTAAAIAGTKISPNFGFQNITTTAKTTTGAFKMTGGSPGSGKVLHSDGDGDASWGTNNDADADPNAERQRLSFNPNTNSLSINNGGHASGNSVTLPSSIEFFANTPRTILIVYAGNSISSVWTKDGSPSGIHNPGANGWTRIYSYEETTWNDGSRTSLGIRATPDMANISGDESIKALQVRVGGFCDTGDENGLFVVAHTDDGQLKQMGDMCESGLAAEANGLLMLRNSDQSFVFMSQHQSDIDRQMTHLWVTIFGGIR